jgi:DNA-binding transcriptional regulator GbsR (MarR family)
MRVIRAATLIYDQICAATGLSRSKVSGGLATLAAEQIVVRKMNGRSCKKIGVSAFLF